MTLLLAELAGLPCLNRLGVSGRVRPRGPLSHLRPCLAEGRRPENGRQAKRCQRRWHRSADPAAEVKASILGQKRDGAALVERNAARQFKLEQGQRELGKAGA